MQAEEIIARIRQAGVVGAGGAGFPTDRKLSAAADVIVVNGAECEPLIQVDQDLMDREAETLVEILQLLCATKKAKGIIALKSKYKPAVDSLTRTVKGTDIVLHLLPNVYPVGDEHVLVYEATGRIVPEGGIPPQVGVIVINVETLLNVARSLAGIPVTEKYVTVGGEVENPGNYLVPIGMNFTQIMVWAKPKITGYRIIEGGPMMGKITDGGVVTKTTKALLVLPENHKLIVKKDAGNAALKRIMGGCCQCRECTDFCPRYLLGHTIRPHVHMRAVAYSLHEPVHFASAQACSECGLCEYFVCPSGLSPKVVNSKIKEALREQQVKLEPPASRQIVRNAREFRQVSADRLTARLDLKKYTRQPQFRGALQAAEVMVKLKQSVGAASRPAVKSGQSVKKGDLIAAPAAGALGANLHASIDGIIKVKKDAIIIIAGKERV